MLNNYKRLTSIRKSKKHLKSEKYFLNKDLPAYTMVKWDKIKKSFLVDSQCGQRSRLFEIYIKIC